MTDIDALLTAIVDLSHQLDELSDDDPRRGELESRRDSLRSEAEAISDSLRHPASVAAEIDMLERRIKEIEAMAIGQGYSEKRLHTTIQDPSAYSHGINRRLEKNHEEELEAITLRLAHLRTLQGDS